MEANREQLAKDIEQELARYFQERQLIRSLREQHRKPTTRAVKEFLCKLGHSRGFLVSARECADIDNREWLYDLVWYQLSDKGYMTTQALAMECELVSELIDDDFQKLVQARADVRLWIACLANEQAAKEHLDHCKRQAEQFSGKMAGDCYVFVTDNWTNPKTLVESFVVGRGQPGPN